MGVAIEEAVVRPEAPAWEGWREPGAEVTMRYLKYAALLGVVMLLTGAMASTASAQVRVGVGIGFGPAYGPAPVCAYGYYPDYPYACAPYGYYGPDWFVNGVFIGAGPWYHGFRGRPVFVERERFFGRGFVDRDRFRGDRRGFVDRDRFRDRGFGRGDFDRGREFHGGDRFHGGRGGEFHGGGGSHGGGGHRGGHR